MTRALTRPAVAECFADAKSRIAFNVRRYRKARGWSQLELARRAGLDRNVPHMIEREQRITLESTCALAVALGVDWPALVAGPETGTED